MSSLNSNENNCHGSGGIIGKMFKNGRYEVIEKIHNGSFGSVYLVE